MGGSMRHTERFQKRNTEYEKYGKLKEFHINERSGRMKRTKTLTVKVEEERQDIAAFSAMLTKRKKKSELHSYSFLLANNRDMTTNDFARDLCAAFDCPAEKIADITALVMNGERF